MSLTTWGQRTGHGGSNRRAFLTYLGRGYSVAIADVARTALDEEDFIVIPEPHELLDIGFGLGMHGIRMDESTVFTS